MWKNREELPALSYKLQAGKLTDDRCWLDSILPTVIYHLSTLNNSFPSSQLAAQSSPLISYSLQLAACSVQLEAAPYLLYKYTHSFSWCSARACSWPGSNRHAQLFSPDEGLFMRALPSSPNTSCRGRITMLATEA